MVGDQSAVTRGRTGPNASQGCVQRYSRIGPRGNGMSPCYRALLRRRGLSSPNGGRNGAAGDRRLDNKGGLSPVSEATGAVYLSFFSCSAVLALLQLLQLGYLFTLVRDSDAIRRALSTRYDSYWPFSELIGLGQRYGTGRRGGNKK